MVDVSNEVLQRISDRLESIETGLAAVRAKTDRLESIETGLEAVRAKTERIESIETELAAVRAKTERIESIETELAAVRARTGEIFDRVDSIEADVSAVRVRVDSQPDMRLLFQNVKLILERMVTMERDLVMLRSAFNDYGRENVTPGEIQAIHQALDTLREADLNREARLRVLEAHLPR